MLIGNFYNETRIQDCPGLFDDGSKTGRRMYPDREPDRLLGGGGTHPGINDFNWRSTLRSHSLDLEVDLVVDWIRLVENHIFVIIFFSYFSLYVFFLNIFIFGGWETFVVFIGRVVK